MGALRGISRLDGGLLFLRVGIGIMFMFHGGPKLLGGPERWERVGGAMGNFGIDFLPVFWGLMAACSEFFGGFLVAVGYLTRPACILMSTTMLVAAVSHLSKGEGLGRASHAIEDGIMFVSLIFIGPGIYSLDNWLRERLNR